MDLNKAGAGGPPLFFPSPPIQAEQAAPSSSAQGPGHGSWEPTNGPSGIALNPVAIMAMTEAELQQEVLWMVGCLKRRSLAEIAGGPAHSDGTLAIKSMIAVWILTTVGKAFGRRLVRLQAVDANALRSIGGVARLIRQAVSDQPVVGAA